MGQYAGHRAVVSAQFYWSRVARVVLSSGWCQRFQLLRHLPQLRFGGSDLGSSSTNRVVEEVLQRSFTGAGLGVPRASTGSVDVMDIWNPVGFKKDSFKGRKKEQAGRCGATTPL